MPDKALHILSYPRSGNHLVRTIVEFACKRPTVSVGEGWQGDPPIYTRSPNEKRRLIEIWDESPAGYKSHSPVGIFENTLNKECDQIIFVLRDPVEAISSHGARSLRKKMFVTKKDLHETVMLELGLYISNLYAFLSFETQNALLVRFEDLLGDGGVNQAKKIMRFCTEDHVPELSVKKWGGLKACAKDSQESLKPKHYRLKERLAQEVAEIVTYDEVNTLIRRHSSHAV